MLALDTNTISYYFRGDDVVRARLHALAPSDVAVPAVVVYELKFGLFRLPPQAREPRLQALAQFLAPLTLLPFDALGADHAARLRAALESLGTPIGPHDTSIAATALAHGATLVTRNVSEFSRVPGLLLENWHPS
ncbi:type II toxin-antitoxin system VapC family toxin [Pseudaquabacterium terrae]|nr:type II toxin-antitoxin system VapC family toxin [Aquabacterium terrae]